MAETASIRRLPDTVINFIAAGEVAQRPYNIVKELLENAIDAGATTIAVEFSSSTLRVQDNGRGINPADYPLLCERHATSKFAQMDDFAQLQTFGFRGEALASISLVSELTVASKVPSATCAYRQSFKGGLNDAL